MTEYKSPLKTALCEFKKKKIKIYKESDNPFFKSKYADLSVILDAIEAEAAELGIVITSRLDISGDGRVLITLLQHKDSDEIIASVFPIFGTKPQEVGSSVTYARRYNIQSLLNLAAEDDDGNAANEAPPVKLATNSPWKTAKERKDAFDTLMAELDNTESLVELSELWKDKGHLLTAFKASDMQVYLELEKRKDSIKTQFQQMESK